ncbi:MAG: complex I subunit 4 family protein, partial [Planctomycetota bacterium]
DQVTTLGTVLSGFDFRWYLFFAMFVGFAIKVPVFPFHTWLPDAHVEAPTSGSMILAGIMLKMGGYGFFRLMYPIAPDVAVSHGVVYFIAGLGMINIVYGALCAMAQNDFKALVAYSSISHMGYVLLGLAAVNGTGFMGGVLQMFNHGVSSAMCFCLVGVIYDRAHHRRLNGFGGMGRVMPFYFGLAIIGFFASLGLPSLNGFVSEVLTFLGAYQPDSLIASGSSVGGMLGLPGIEARWIVYVSLTGIIFTAAYILWTVQRVFFGKVAEEKYLQFKDLNWNEACTLIPLAAMCIIFGVFPSLIIDFMEPSLNAIVESVRTAALAAAGGVG